MKRNLLIAFLFVIGSVSGQNLTCIDFHEGTFIAIDEANNSTYRITREGDLHIEKGVSIPAAVLKRNPDAMKPSHSRVTWIDECTYVIVPDFELGPDTRKRRFLERQGGITVRIDSIRGRCFYWTAMLDLEVGKEVYSDVMCKEE